MHTQSVVLRDERDANGSRSVSARITAEGDLIVEGHDLGKGVDSLLGYREYEWTITIAAADTRELLGALSGLEPFLKERDIPFAFWNRVGD